ncbi:MAG: TetR/AcrR family transcriptional regulator [Vulcanimicrobiota bacterium]
MEKLKTKQRILSLASRAFFKVGFRAMTMDKLAENAGISKKTIYKYFSGKSHLVRETISMIIDSVFEEQDNYLNRATDPVEQFIYFFIPLFQLWARLGHNQVNEIAGQFPEAFEVIDNRRRKRIPILVNIYEEGVKKGYFRPVNCKLLYSFIQDSVLNFLTPGKLASLGVSPTETIEMLLHIFLFGLVADEKMDVVQSKFSDLKKILPPPGETFLFDFID